MPKRMLIDASHPEETRVVVLDGQRVDEFDFEAASKRPLKGNIYLAKVTRVEPSLQAAFVEYGGNRQGFLAFSEIHPDYYQIPIADRQALLAEQQEEARRRSDDEFESVATGIASVSDAELEAEEAEDSSEAHRSDAVSASNESGTEHMSDELPTDSGRGEDGGQSRPEVSVPAVEVLASAESVEGIVDQQTASEAAVAEEAGPDTLWSNENASEHEGFHETGESDSGDLRHDEARPSSAEAPVQPLRAPRPSQRWVRRKHYKIQEVIKRKQIMLVQVVKEERGTKGAALTTYLSLAGRYCVLMPNTPRGGGISRKITNAADRNRLKAAAATLELPEGMGVIIRTAGANRTKLEIKRDYEYLLRLWDQIRELTLASNAPACVYEEGDIIKRAIRDLYNKDVAEILVEGEDGYKNAKEFMRMLMPSHAKNVKLYRDALPLFQKFHIEAQLDAMFQPTVTLKSGGYIVINQTEALVSIDVNSGRATREHSIEETAHKTNLEAADEVGRQLRLRDLAGLIVIDFIDMEDSRNDRDVEKRLRDAVKNDRARVQIGKISQFGLLEMSRQRLRAGVVAGSTVPCPHCGGQGIVRSVESTALRVLRALDEEGQRGRAAAVVVHVANDVALYALNQKRQEIARMEAEYDLAVTFEPKEDLIAGSFDLERVGQRSQSPPKQHAVSVDDALAIPADTAEPVETEVPQDETDAEDPFESAESQTLHTSQPSANGKKRRRRRRGRGGSHPPQTALPQHGDTHLQSGQPEPQPIEHSEASAPATAEDEGGNPQNGTGGPPASTSRRRRRRRRKPHSEASPNGGSMMVSPGPADDQAGEDATRLPDEPHSPFASPVVLNAPSEPVWSLGNDPVSEPREAEAEVAPEPFYGREAPPVTGLHAGTSAPQGTRDVPLASGSREVPSASTFANETMATHGREDRELPAEQPARRGWWQRTFRKE